MGIWNWTRRGLFFGVTMALVAGTMTLVMASGPALAPSSHSVPAPRSGDTYYLSLGDSLSVGYQPTSATTGHETTQGYVDDIYKVYKNQIESLKEWKLGCPGESTSTMIDGGICSYDDSAVTSESGGIGSQLAAAEYFLDHATAGGYKVAFITIDIGANDVDGCANYVTHDNSATNEPDPDYQTDVTNCVEDGVTPTTVGADGYPASDYGITTTQNGISGIDTNLPTILSDLESADANVPGGPAPIYGMNYYDPFLALYLEGGSLASFAENSTTLAADLNSNLASDYAGAPTPVPVADVATAFSSTNTTVPENYMEGGAGLALGSTSDPLNVQAICAWTWECTPWENIHANQTGYEQIAAAFETTIGLLGGDVSG